MNINLDALIEDAVTYGELSAGTDPTWLAQRVDPRRVAVMTNGVEKQGGKEGEWTPEEDAFLRDSYMWMTDAELGQSLGRTANAVDIRRERILRLRARTKSDEWLNSHDMQRMLGTSCSKLFLKLIQRGLLRGRRLPLGQKEIWVVARQDLLRFVINPMNWIYFKPERVQDPQMRRYIELRRANWTDAWWSPGQVSSYHGVSHGLINKYIHCGKLPAVRWYNWHILRSDAVRCRFVTGKGSGGVTWTDAGDAFLIVGRAVGLSYSVLCQMTGRAHVDARLRLLWQRGRMPEIIQQNALAVGFTQESGRLYADWRQWPGRFPYLERTVKRFLDGYEMSNEEARLMLGIFANWLGWHATTDEQRSEAHRLMARTRIRTESVRKVYGELMKSGFSLKG